MKVAKYAAIALAVVLAACGKTGSEFEGKWQNVKKPAEVFEITRNGDAFLMQINGKKIPATVKDGNLTVTNFFSFTFAHIKESDTLTGAGEEFKRVK